MKAKLLSTAAVATLAVFMVMDAGAAFAAETCSFANRDSLFGGGCRTERGFRNGNGESRFGPRYDDTENGVVEADGVDTEVDGVEEKDGRGWGHDRRGKRGYGKHRGRHHGGKHHGKRGGWDNDKGGKHHGKRGGWDNDKGGKHHGKRGGRDNDNDGKHGKGKGKGKSKGGYGDKSKGGMGKGKGKGPSAPN